MCRIGYVLFMFIVLFASCKSRKALDKYKKPFDYGHNTLLKYVVNYGGSEYYLKIKIKSFGDSCSFIYSMTNAERSEGSVDMSAWAMQFATAHDNHFNGGSKVLQNKTTLWFSEKSLVELIERGLTTVVPNYRDSVLLQKDSMAMLPILIDGTKKNMPILKASGTSISGKKQYWVLHDKHFPLIVYMDIGWQLRLESISHVPDLNLNLKPTMFSFKPGLKLIYAYEEFGCGRDIVYEFVSQTDKWVTINYEFYKYACLYGFDDEHFKGKIEIPIDIWLNPKDFVIPIPTKNETIRLQTGHPFFLDKKTFARLFNKGSAEFDLSHFIYEPTEEDYQYMDSLDVVVAKEALSKAHKTKLLLKEADVETGYYMYPVEINQAPKVTESIKLQATEIESKKLYVYPSDEFPIILSHYDEDLGFDWNLVGIETPK